jgi:2-hydroxycyclohexanecarboxyl-CoA dehydrogenase
MMNLFAGKVVIVVGAAAKGNIGQSIARRFAQEGASVVVAGRHVEVLSELASEIGGAHQLCDFSVRSSPAGACHPI